VSWRVQLTGGEWLSFGEAAGECVVVAVRARAACVIHDPSQQSAVWRAVPGAPGKSCGQDIAGDSLNPFAFPLAIGGTYRFDENALLIARRG
jgi:hypothetical protein